MYFPDVARGYWGFLDIIEAAKPDVKVPDPPSGSQDTYYKVTAVNGLHIRSGAGSSHSILATVPFGTVLKGVDTANAPWYKVNYSNMTGYAHSDYLALTTEPDPPAAGDGVISATAANIALYKTLYLTASVNGSSSGLTWQSDNGGVAMVVKPDRAVDSGKSFVYGKSAGTANIIVRNAAGQEVARCKVTVGAPEAMRFIATEPNAPSAGQEVALIAVTDTAKTAVKFVVTGPEEGTYETTAYTDETKSSGLNPDLPQNISRNFTKTITLNKTGTYTLRAYSRTSSGGWSESYKEKKMLVIASQSYTEVSAEKRATSSKMMPVIAQFEGAKSDVYLDTLASNIPTVGCGYVVSKNGTFYNNLTATEMTAMLGETINSKGYEAAVENYRSKNGIRMNQAQFDALVSFAYNLGGNIFEQGYDTFKILLNATSATGGSGTVSVGPAALYSSADSSSSTGNSLAQGTTVNVTEMKRVDDKVDQLWYKVTSGSGSGWVRGGRIKMDGAGAVDLGYIDEQLFGSNLLQFHLAASGPEPGLVTRRLAEAKIFCYGSYEEAYHGSKTYTTNAGFDIPSRFSYTETDGVGRWVPQ